jgi:hypothetical protein
LSTKKPRIFVIDCRLWKSFAVSTRSSGGETRVAGVAAFERGEDPLHAPMSTMTVSVASATTPHCARCPRANARMRRELGDWGKLSR